MDYQQMFKQYGISISDQQLQMLEVYADLLIEWNKKFNLTAITDKDDIYLKHFLDCLLLADKLQDNTSLIDVGTGAGFPGIVIKIYKPNIRVVLLEPNNKKVSFLEEVVTQLNLQNIFISNQRSEDYCRQHYQQFDYVTARAVASLNILCELCLPLIKVGGIFYAMKGPKALEELQSADKAIKELSCQYSGKEQFELQDSTRIILKITKINNTLKKYPRNYGQIKKRPL
ncbi:MAG: 16S rRNA (guanine(527)-N(7))-methyltransferase RsmG [Erysipelotrichia bacterium]|nr:16S rRNA (guanine(527)-N(7))-methyltransferase RsmG [Erysipelotrichia bacterium]